MKKIFKFIPVALAALAMTSCSNDDFFGLANEEEDGVKLIANVPDEIGEDGITRAARAIDGSGFQWSVGDVLRVYDSKLQKFDIFEMKEGKTFFTLKGTTQFVKDTNEEGNIDYAKAVFVGNPAGEISYSGWKQEGTDGVLTALVNIPNKIDYKEVNSKYISALPMWGDVTSKVSSLSDETATYETSLAYLSGQAKVVFKNGGKNTKLYARVQSVRFATSDDVTTPAKKNVNGTDITAAMIATEAEKAAIKTALVNAFKEGGAGYAATATIHSSSQAIGNCLIANQDAPLSGWFEARLEDEGYIQNTTNSAVAQPEDRSFVQVELAQANMNEYENVVFLPLAPQEYELLVVEYSEDGTTWSPLRAKFDYTVEYKGNGQFSNLWNAELQTVTYSLTYKVTGLESTYEIGRYMSLYNSANGSVELDLEGNFATIDGKLPEMYTIYVPQLNHDMVVNIKKPTSGTNFNISAKNLVIADAEGVTNFDKTVTINFEGFTSEATNNIQIKTARPIQITGDFTDVTNGIVAANTQKLVLGTETKAFKAKVVNLAKGDGEDVVTAVEINDVTTPATKIETLTNTDGVGITINSGEVETLQLVKNNDQTITMNGGKISTKIAKPSADLTASFKVTVNSKGAALIKDAETKTTGSGDDEKALTYVFNSTITSETAAAAVAGNAQEDIYTAAQFMAMTNASSATAFKLHSNIAVDPEFTWTSINDNDDKITSLTGDEGVNITGLTAALFETLKFHVNTLTITGATIAKDAANQGVLANSATVGSNLTIDGVKVVNATVGAASDLAANTANIGGLIGRADITADATLIIKDCSVTGTVKGYYNLGGYIGAVNSTNNGAKLVFSKTGTASLGSNVQFLKSYWTTDATDTKCGTVGNFVGSLINASNTVAITIGGNNNTTTLKDNAFNLFFAANKITNTAVVDHTKALEGWLEFARNTNAGKVYKGMENQLIGYSTGDITASGLTVFGKANVKVADHTATSSAVATGIEVITKDNYINIFGAAE